MRRADYWSNQAPSNFPSQNTPRLFGIPNDEDKGTLTTSLFTRALFVTALAIGRFVISLGLSLSCNGACGCSWSQNRTLITYGGLALTTGLAGLVRSLTSTGLPEPAPFTLFMSRTTFWRTSSLLAPPVTEEERYVSQGTKGTIDRTAPAQAMALRKLLFPGVPWRLRARRRHRSGVEGVVTGGLGGTATEGAPSCGGVRGG